MAEENTKQDGNGNQGVSGNGKTKVATLVEKAKAGARLLMGQVQEDATALKKPQKTQLWKSLFRVKHDDTTRSRALGVLSNVFLHLHPAKVIATPCATATPGAWGASPFTCSLC